ncbi:MAG: TorF family putative porin [Rickettsiales bacterium]
MMNYSKRLVLGVALLAIPRLALAADNANDATPPASSFSDQFSFSGAASVTSDYAYRGVTQNDEHVTPQLGVELAHDSGIYASIWGSPVDFNDGDEARTEIDLSLGYRVDLNEKWSADARYTYYAYPGAAASLDYDYSEISFAAAYDFGHAKLGGFFGYSPNFFADSGEAEYIQAKLDVPLPYEFSLHAYLGKQYVDDNAAFGYPDTVDWNIGAGYTYNQIGLDLSYIDTNLKKSECADGCSSRIVGTVTYSF